MKTIFALALATIIASPAFAQSYDPDLGTGNITQATPALQLKLQRNAHDAYAQVPHAGSTVIRSFTGQATDPDANIRFQLNRESLQGRW